jgi:hypothetical protein
LGIIVSLADGSRGTKKAPCACGAGFAPQRHYGWGVFHNAGDRVGFHGNEISQPPLSWRKKGNSDMPDERKSDAKKKGGRRKEETNDDNLTKKQQGTDQNRTLEKPNT